MGFKLYLPRSISKDGVVCSSLWQSFPVATPGTLAGDKSSTWAHISPLRTSLISPVGPGVLWVDFTRRSKGPDGGAFARFRLGTGVLGWLVSLSMRFLHPLLFSLP